ncbi:MAG: hypothetical protein ACRC3B_04725 [Bacteroidia bacterium]
MLRNFVSALALLTTASAFCQASLSVVGTPYTQNFNSLPNATDAAAVASWANNTYLTGWYVSTTAPIIEATCGPTAASVNNSGGAYVIASGTDRSLGARASGATGTINFGVRLVNSTGSALTSIYVRYYGEQWSIAENQSNVNTLAFSYQTGTTVTSLTAGTWTNVTALNFQQIYTSSQSSGLGGSACGGTSAQCLALNGNAAANRVLIQACITVAVPAGNEIFLRWQEVNDAANDHHLQIDDLEVWPFVDPCATILPVELTSFTVELSNKKPLLRWETASEKDNARFEIERSADGNSYEKIGIVNGNGTTSQPHSYSFYDVSAPAGFSYYRFKQIDYNGSYTYSPLRAIEVPVSADASLQVISLPEGLSYSISGIETPETIEMWSSGGELIFAQQYPQSTGILPVKQNGLYLIRVTSNSGSSLLIQKVIY